MGPLASSIGQIGMAVMPQTWNQPARHARRDKYREERPGEIHDAYQWILGRPLGRARGRHPFGVNRESHTNGDGTNDSERDASTKYESRKKADAKAPKHPWQERL